MYSLHNLATEDYFPILVSLTFTLVTNNIQCVTIPIINDPIIESDEIFFLQSIDTNLTQTIPQTVMVTIVNDDGKLRHNNYFRAILIIMPLIIISS